MQPDLTLVAGARVDLHHASAGIFGIFGIRPGGSVGGDLWEMNKKSRGVSGYPLVN